LLKPAQRMIEDTIDLVSKDAVIADLLVSFATAEDRVYSHSVAVAVLSCMVARQVGWNASSTLFKLSLAGLFHDVGLREIDPGILSKPRPSRTREETNMFESHPSRGHAILLGIQSLPEDVAKIAFQHHERVSRSGYPLRPEETTLHPLAVLVGIVDQVVEGIMPVELNQTPMTSTEAIVHQFSLASTATEQNYLRRLSKILGLHHEVLAAVG